MVPANKGENLVIDDRDISLMEICHDANMSLSQQLISLQDEMTQPYQRSLIWAKRLECLKVDLDSREGTKRILRRVSISSMGCHQKYVAVSYCNKPDLREGTTINKYVVECRGKISQSRIRGTVLDRIMLFLKHKKCDTFWIDEDCIGKEDEENAFAAMDMVYRRCHTSIALLWKPLESQKQARLLDELLRGKFVKAGKKKSAIQWTGNMPPVLIAEIVTLLRLITSDPWWQRCWTFQEEFCSSERMEILIPSKSLSESAKYQCLEILPGHFTMNAIRFREQATRFCLALSKNPNTEQLQLSRCQTIIRCAQRYQTMDGSGYWHGHMKPMSTRIMRDLCDRRLSHLTELPAIVANCCSYTTRIRVCKPQISLSMLLLALFVLNGELLSYTCEDVGACLGKSLSAFLRHQAFDHCIPPKHRYRLTSLKRYRIPRATLSHEGIQTWGQIWKLHQTIRLKNMPQPRHFDDKDVFTNLPKFKRARLRQLAEDVERIYGHCQLAADIRSFLEDDKVPTASKNPKHRLMDAMARRICGRMSRGRSLALGTLVGSNECRGVFIPEQWRASNGSYFVFTAWEAGEMIPDTKDTHDVEKFVSLTIQRCPSDEDRWTIRNWTNGLYFFRGLKLKRVVFSWPEYMCYQP